MNLKAVRRDRRNRVSTHPSKPPSFLVLESEALHAVPELAARIPQGDASAPIKPQIAEWSGAPGSDLPAIEGKSAPSNARAPQKFTSGRFGPYGLGWRIRAKSACTGS